MEYFRIKYSIVKQYIYKIKYKDKNNNNGCRNNDELGFLYFDAMVSMLLFFYLLLGILMYWHCCAMQLSRYEQDEQMLQNAMTYIEIGKHCYMEHMPIPIKQVKKGIFTYVMETTQEVLQGKAFEVYRVSVYKEGDEERINQTKPYYEVHTFLYRKN